MDTSEMDQMGSNSKSLNNILSKHHDLLLAYTSDHQRVKVFCEEFVENYKQKCAELETESKNLQLREDELKKTEDQLKKTETKLMKERSKLELKMRAREVLSRSKQLGIESHSYKKESEDLKKELEKLHARTTELEEELKIKDEKVQIALMELETALQVSEDWEGVDLDETFNNLQSELINAEELLNELKKIEEDNTSCLKVKDDELDDARNELIDEIKTWHKRNNICVKTVGPGNEKCPPVPKLWNKKEDREATVKECIEPLMKKWKTEKNRVEINRFNMH